MAKRRGFFGRIRDAFDALRGRPSPAPEPIEEPPEPPPKRAPSRRVEERTPEDIAQAIWNDTVADIVNDVEKESQFVNFVSRRIEQWRTDESMLTSTGGTNDVRNLINWLIIESNTWVGHDDVDAVLARIYEEIAGMRVA